MVWDGGISGVGWIHWYVMGGRGTLVVWDGDINGVGWED